MAAEKITMEQIMEMDLPPIIIYAIPVMLFLVLVEYLISVYQNKKVYVGKDLLASIMIGSGNLIVSAGVKFMLFSIVLIFYNMVPWRIPPTWWSFLVCIVALDFCRYWGASSCSSTKFLVGYPRNPSLIGAVLFRCFFPLVVGAAY